MILFLIFSDLNKVTVREELMLLVFIMERKNISIIESDPKMIRQIFQTLGQETQNHIIRVRNKKDLINKNYLKIRIFCPKSYKLWSSQHTKVEGPTLIVGFKSRQRSNQALAQLGLIHFFAKGNWRNTECSLKMQSQSYYMSSDTLYCNIGYMRSK